MYQDANPDLSKQELEDLILWNGKQLKIRTSEGELWELPTGRREDLNPSLQVA